eukprot:UN01735
MVPNSKDGITNKNTHRKQEDRICLPEFLFSLFSINHQIRSE